MIRYQSCTSKGIIIDESSALQLIGILENVFEQGVDTTGGTCAT